jgi:hypothetical protein
MGMMAQSWMNDMMVFDEVHGHFRIKDNGRSRQASKTNFPTAEHNLKQSMTKKVINRTDQRKENY